MLRDIDMDGKCVMVSFDVTNLYSNIHVKDTIEQPEHKLKKKLQAR